MKRTDRVRVTTRAAATRGIAFELLRNSGDHEIWSLNGVRVSVPRHREINERTAMGILRTLEAALGKGWWR